MTDIPALIARLERAKAGSRELDAQIVVALDLRPDWCKPDGELWIDKSEAGEPVIRIHDPRIGRRGGGNVPVGTYPHFTESLDAAATLVAAGCRFMVEFGRNGGGAQVWTPSLEMFAECKAAATPALALCIAALRVRLL